VAGDDGRAVLAGQHLRSRATSAASEDSGNWGAVTL
jgi:hypothetical protein